jgi:broad specificity phosphatase PhoE
MNGSLPLVYLARHGETAWSLTGQHTGLTDLPLTGNGERVACLLGERLEGLIFVRVYTSRLQRAHRTCEVPGFGAVAEVDHDLVEWAYGQYEGRTGVDIRAERPDWQLFRDGCPGGESPAQVAKRADRVGAVTKRFVSALLLDDVVLRGGNGRKLKRMAKGYRAGDNATVFLDRFQLWKEGKK